MMRSGYMRVTTSSSLAALAVLGCHDLYCTLYLVRSDAQTYAARELGRFRYYNLLVPCSRRATTSDVHL